MPRQRQYDEGLAAANFFRVSREELLRRTTKQEVPLGEFKPSDVWQTILNNALYGNQEALGLFFMGFNTATTFDYRVSYALAKDSLGYYQSRSGEISEAEFGCAFGNMGEAYLTSLREFDPNLYGRVRLHLCDYSHPLILATAYNTSLLQHIKNGRASLNCLDATGDLNALGSLDCAFSHELGDDLGTTTMMLRGGRFVEHHIRPVLRRGVVIGELNEAGRVKLGDPEKLVSLMRAGQFDRLGEFELGFLKALKYEQRLQEVDWSRIPHASLVRNFLEEIGEGVLVGVNVGFTRHLESLYRVLKPGGRYMFFDYGWSSKEEIAREQYPQVRISAEGQITSDMNFPLTFRIAEAIGFRVHKVGTQKDFVSQAFGEPALMVHSILRTHPAFSEGSESVLSLVELVKTVVSPHYRGPPRNSKARRYVEHNLRKEGKTPEQILELIDEAGRRGAFERERLGGNIDVGSYLLLSEVEPAFPDLERSGFNTEGIAQLFREDPYTHPMKYVVLER